MEMNSADWHVASSMKTVIVLDHSPQFASTSKVTFEVGTTQTAVHKTTLEKSLWTCCVESALEYARCVSDVFSGSDKPRGVRFVVSDFVGRLVSNVWPKIYSQDTVVDHLWQCGAPDADGDQDSCDIVNGITLAFEALTQATEHEKQGFTSTAASTSTTDTPSAAGSHGRILLFTQLRSDEHINEIFPFNPMFDREIESHVCEQIDIRNSWVRNQDANYVPLASVELCVVNVLAQDSASAVSDRVRYKVTDAVGAEVHSSEAGPALNRLTHRLLIKHYDLASTTVTGIPMKEETHAGTSTNYDVELLHERRSHGNLQRAGLLSAGQLNDDTTVRLCWCTPNAKDTAEAVKPPVCAVFRVTPASVNSRPSACLTQFLLGGRNVMLEVSAALRQQARLIQPNLNHKLISHMLCCTGGVIYLHSFTFGKCAADEAPSISEGVGGRVSDYRVPQMAALLHEAHLQPPDPSQIAPLNVRALASLNALTQFWPLTNSDSIIFSMLQKFEPLVSVLRQSSLSADEVTKCRQKILDLQGMQERADPLIMSGNTCPKLKGQRNRNEQYQQMFHELEQYLANYAGRSADHHKVYMCLLTCMNRAEKRKFVSIYDDLNPEHLLQLAPLFGNKTRPAGPGSSSSTATQPSVSRDPRKRKLNEMDIKKEAVDVVEPKKQVSYVKLKPGESISVYQLFLADYQKRWENWKDFDGRAASGGKPVELYSWLDLDNKRAEAEVHSMNTNTNTRRDRN